MSQYTCNFRLSSPLRKMVPSGGEGKLGVVLESLQGPRHLRRGGRGLLGRFRGEGSSLLSLWSRELVTT